MKKITYIISFILLLIVNINIINASDVTTYERTESNNYGVNKKYNITSSNKSNILKTKYVDASKKIYDFSDILTDSEEEKLYNQIIEYINLTNMDLVIVTDELKYTNDNDNVVYADDFYDYNDFGINFEHYSGTLLFRNTYSKDPYYNMSTTGNALLYYNDDRIDSILNSIYNNIHSGNYYDAFSSYITFLTRYYNNGIPNSLKDYKIDDSGKLVYSPVYRVHYLYILIFAIVVTSVIILVLVKKNKMVNKKFEAWDYLNKDSINYRNKYDRFITSHVSSYRINSFGGPGGGGGGSSFHSSSSGGSHGGGGRHG